jgi:uncharacterized damage-inducible protein DinB
VILIEDFRFEISNFNFAISNFNVEEETMSNREFYIQRFEQELPVFLRVFRALPTDQLDYRPHARSKSARELVWLFADEGKAALELANTGRVDWSETPPSGSLDEMLAAYERDHTAFIERVKNLDDAAWGKTAQFLVGGQVALEMPLGEMLWMFLFDAVHHRGQLSTYIRPMGGKVPSIYGPSADDPGM